ncbi:MAG TPA: peptidoglycan-binding domain-containing protein [Gemmatimonadales bacterium]|nr:peptidoglycan-binding domain-containing protein [Gemmatimonadales bacterium]
MRTLPLVTALAALTFSAGALAAQSTSTSQQPASKPTMNQAPAVHVKSDTTKKATASAKATTKTRHAAWTKDDVKTAQEGLTKAGLYKGKVSGIMNADTRKALREYQKQNKLPVTGRLSDSVLVKLKSA